MVAGLVINVLDVAVTLLFAAKPLEAELRRQRIQPSPFTPPYYSATNVVGGIPLTYTYSRFAESLGPGVNSAIIASLVMWSTTRIYGGGHVVMRQMPLWIFAIMSTCDRCRHVPVWAQCVRGDDPILAGRR